MALDELFKTFEFLKKRIEEHREYLSQDETRTRQVLIDPLLKELGWDVGDPGVVELEYRVEREYDAGTGKADYVLKSGSRLSVVIEAKRLGSTLLDKATNQVLNYANSKGVPWMVVSDGNAWAMYEVFKQGELKDRLRMSFVVTEISASECALKSLALWRPNLYADDEPADALEPVLVESPANTSTPAEVATAGAESCVTVADCVDAPRRGGWHPVVGDFPKGLPTSVRFGEATPTEWKTWKQFLTDVAMYLVSSGSIRAADLPVSVTQGPNCVISDEPVHLDGSTFTDPVRLQADMWLEAHGNRDTRLGRSRWLLKTYLSNPESVQFCFDGSQ